jgi:hypothetical protein
MLPSGSSTSAYGLLQRELGTGPITVSLVCKAHAMTTDSSLPTDCSHRLVTPEGELAVLGPPGAVVAMTTSCPLQVVVAMFGSRLGSMGTGLGDGWGAGDM